MCGKIYVKGTDLRAGRKKQKWGEYWINMNKVKIEDTKN